MVTSFNVVVRLLSFDFWVLNMAQTGLENFKNIKTIK